jgi:hypothetical protein
MNWVRTHYDRCAVLAGALFLLLCACFIWQSAAVFQEEFTSLREPGPAKPATPPIESVELSAAVGKLRQPPQWSFSGRSGLFVPEKHFIGPNGMPVTLQTTEVHPPVPNEWLDQFGLPIADADVLTQDADGDGFDNLEEWRGHTNPTDKASRPPYLSKLKLKSVATEPLPAVFSSRTGDTYAINFIDAHNPSAPDGSANIDRAQPTQFAQKGQTIRGTRLRIVGFREKSAPGKFGAEIDVSELRLENLETGEEVTLVKEKPAISPESVGTFTYSWGEPHELTVKKDEEFSLPPETEIRYKLVDVQPARAVIVNTQKPEERIEIDMLPPN